LDKAPEEVVEEGGSFEDDKWRFAQGPVNENGEPNREYSPLKRIRWEGRDIIVNAPFAKWGVGEVHGQIGWQVHGQIGGPISTKDCSGEADAIKPCGFATFKLHRAIYRTDVFPYLVYFAASDESVAQSLKVTYVPKLNGAGRLFEDNSTGFLINFRNGVRSPSGQGSLSGFQPGVTGYGSPTMSTYTPIVEIQNAAFNCGEQRGRAFEPGFECPERAKLLTGDEEGFFRFNDLSVASTGIRVTRSPKSERVILIVSAPVSVRP
jgi:hypothetical protein